MFFLGIDQGTSGSRAAIMDSDGCMVGYAYRPLARLHPQPDWVEQDPEVIAREVSLAITSALGEAGIDPADVAACGITCQRNTTFVWDKNSGRPLANAIVWQDLRTEPLLAELAAWPPFDQARERLGYPPGTYMGALQLAWRLRHQPAVQEAAAAGRLQIGLSAAWLVRALGRPAGHFMDRSLVQATGLYDYRHGRYWEEWLARLAVPQQALPQPAPTLHDYGTITIQAPDGRTADVPVRAMIGDQQAALFGHRCWQPGQAECTHGTASYVEVNIGPSPPKQTPVNIYHAWSLDGKDIYCLEAATTVTGAAIRWMREQARLFDRYEEVDTLARTVNDGGGIVFVPAFTGLEHPYLTPNARGTLLGLTLGTGRAHIVRAFLEAIGFQLRDILQRIAADGGLAVNTLRVGGGVASSDVACQVQADLLGLPVERPSFRETTSWAAAALAGLGHGQWGNLDHLPPLPGTIDCFEPQLSQAERDARFARWQQAIDLTRTWGQVDS